MKVAFSPFWRPNPYHPELEKSLNSFGVQVTGTHCLKEISEAHSSGEEQIDLLHLHALPRLILSPVAMRRYLFSYSRLGRLQRSGVPVIFTVHDFHNHEAKHRRIENLFARSFSRKADALITHGETAKSIVNENWGPLRSVTVIPHGHYINSYPNSLDSASARRTLGLEERNTVFLFLGMIRPYKGVPEMIKAFRACPEPNARLLIVGKPLNEALKAELMTSIEGDSRIKFLPGMFKDEDVQLYMNAADMVVLPYRRALTSGVAILAMSFAKACIAPRTGCITDALDSNGAIFFNPSEDQELERAFRDALSRRSDLAQMGSYNFKRASAWDWTSIARATAAVYQESIIARQRNSKRVPSPETRQSYAN